MKTACAPILAAFLLFCTTALAQTSGKPAMPSSTLSGGINLRAIAAAPFSADVLRESVLVMADGTQVLTEVHGKMFRDSEGRTRSETQIVAGATPQYYVTIVDPVQQIRITLNPQTKTATRSPLPAPAPMRSQAGLLAGITNALARPPAIVAHEDLGSAMLEGFTVAVSRMTRPAENTVKVEKARNMVIETWFSPELKIELQAKLEVPNKSAVITRLQNIVATDQDRALFEVPADYTVQDISTKR
ncbi:MAG: hypothetical protein WA738_17645 [Candidatus Angelobacter sp.]